MAKKEGGWLSGKKLCYGFTLEERESRVLTARVKCFRGGRSQCLFSQRGSLELLT